MSRIQQISLRIIHGQANVHSPCWEGFIILEQTSGCCNTSPIAKAGTSIRRALSLYGSQYEQYS